MRAFYWILRILSAVTLFFFSWTFLPLWQVAAWAAEPPQKTGGKDQGVKSVSRGPATSGERFEKALEAIRENVSRAGDKADKGEDDAKEREIIKSKRAEIESADAEFKKEFAATEKKLRDAKLPKEILDRHYKFVKHYDDNLKELKTNLDDVDKATTKADRKAKMAKAKAHLVKTKTPSKHVPLDPNNLPFRSVKGKERAPRLKKEEFEKEFGPQKKQQTRKTAELWDADQRGWTRIVDSALRRYSSPPTLHSSRILLAYNSSIASDMQLTLPFPLGESIEVSGGVDISPSALPASAFSDATPHFALGTPSLLVAQATGDLPTAADLAETPEILFTQEIRAKAQELEFKPVKIYEWVRNNIDYQPYYGSFKGAQQTLLEGAGNDFDQASLLIALLRVSQIEARYAYGTIDLPVEKVMNWVGGATDPRMAGAILASKGIPAKLVLDGGVVKSIQLEHTWVDAWIHYFPSRGAVHKTGRGDTWIPLDASFKQFTYKQGMDMYTLLGINGEQFLQSYVTDTRDITAYQDYSMRMINNIDANQPSSTTDDIIGASTLTLTKSIVKQEFPFLLGTLPYKVIAKVSEFSEVPATTEYTVTIQIDGESLGSAGLNYSGSLNYLSDKRITVAYESATTSDEAVVARYDGNLLSVPPYLINVKPVLRVNGSIAATGVSIGLGQDQNIVIGFAGPDGDVDRIQNVITAGNYAAVILQSQNTPLVTPSSNMIKLIENSKNVDSPSITLDDLLGQMLYTIGLSYFQKISFENEIYAKTLQLINLRQPSEAMVTHKVKVNYLFGLPSTISEGAVNIDVDRNINSVFSPTQDAERIKAFMILSGLSSSAWENRILNAFFDVPAVSSTQLLKLAAQQNIPIYTITAENSNDVLPQLQVEAEVKTDIMNAINAGKKAIVSKTTLMSGQWRGVGYIIIDPTIGAAGYQISGGLSGGDCDYLPVSIRRQPQFVFDYWKTFWIRGKALKTARAYKDTIYVWGGKLSTPDEGFDCSGFVQAVTEGINLPEGNAANQYDKCKKNDWLRPYEERMPGVIVWNPKLTHVGIEGGINEIEWQPGSGSIAEYETIVHASGRPCYPNAELAPKGTPPECITSACIPIDLMHPQWGGNPSCGTYSMVIESPVKVFGDHNDKICNPR